MHLGAHTPFAGGVDHRGAGGFTNHAVFKAEGIFLALFHRQRQHRTGILVLAGVFFKIEQADGILHRFHHRAHQRIGVGVHLGDQSQLRHLALPLVQPQIFQQIFGVALFNQRQIPDIQLGCTLGNMVLEHRIEKRIIRLKGGGKASFAL